MSNKIKPGAMGSSSTVGMPPEFANSLAAAIEAALNDILSAEGKQTFALDDNSRAARDRRMLFIAIAQGIVSHLTANETAFVIQAAGVDTGETINIQTE